MPSCISSRTAMLPERHACEPSSITSTGHVRLRPMSSAAINETNLMVAIADLFGRDRG